MALGNNHQVVTIAGAQSINDPANPPIINRSYGFAALPSNIGRYARDDFVVIPQFQAEVGYELTPRLRAYLGYNILWWANVARAGEAIDYGLDLSQTVARPTFAFSGSDYVIHGMTVGFELSF